MSAHKTAPEARTLCGRPRLYRAELTGVAATMHVDAAIIVALGADDVTSAAIDVQLDAGASFADSLHFVIAIVALDLENAEALAGQPAFDLGEREFRAGRDSLSGGRRGKSERGHGSGGKGERTGDGEHVVFPLVWPGHIRR